jgi:general secretion pathway protein D
MKHMTKKYIAWLFIAVMGLQAPLQVLAQLLNEAEGDKQPRYIIGTGQVLAPPSTKGQITGNAAGFKFEEAPLGDVVSLVLREIAKVDYVIHPPVSGTVTLATQGEVTADHAVLLLEAALQANGVQLARDPRGVYHIGRPEALRGIVPGLRQVTNGPLPPGQGAVVVPLKYIGATEMAAILRPMASPEALVRVDPLRNLIVMTGTRPQVEGWLDIVNTFDIDLLKGMSVGVFPLKHVSTKDVETAIRIITGGNAASPARSPNAAAGANTNPINPAPAAGNSQSPAASADASMLGAMRILPIENINSILIVTPRASYLEEARRWIEKLDQPGSGLGDQQLFVYPVQNGNAKHLASVLNGLFGNGAPVAPTAVNNNRAVAPGLGASTAGGLTFGGAGGAGFGGFGVGQGNAQGASNIQGAGISTVTLNSGVRVMADEINNAILVYGSRSEFDKIQSTLKRLDVPPTQVLIEASIIEVSLNDDLKYGLQWVFSDKNRGGLSGSGVLSNTSGGALGGAAAGFSYTLKNSLGNVSAIINALADKSLVNVISSPSLMVLDNHTASIAVGTQQPVKSSDTFINGTNVTSAIQYKDTGVTLSVTPSVNAGNMVTMQINQAVTDVGAADTATGQRSFLQRQFNSKVAVRSGETLVLGGLIRDNTTNGKSGIPLLQDLPIFGSLFGADSKSVARTELLVVITPRVVRTDVDIKAIGQDMRDRMKGLPELPKPASFAPTVTEITAMNVPVKPPVVTPSVAKPEPVKPLVPNTAVPPQAVPLPALIVPPSPVVPPPPVVTPPLSLAVPAPSPMVVPVEAKAQSQVTSPEPSKVDAPVTKK